MRLLSKITGFAAIAALGLAAGAAQASPNLSCAAGVCNLILSPVDTGLQTTELATTLDLPLFDTSIGTLTGVTFEVNEVISSGGTVQNTAAQPQTFTEKVDSQLTVTDPGNPGLPSTFLSQANLLDAHVSQTFTALGVGSTAQFNPPNGTASSGLISQTGAGIDMGFEALGGGFDALNISTVTTQAASGGGGNVNQSLATQAEFDFTVQYDYCGGDAPACPTGTPEPASMTLLGVGLVGLGAVIRRRRNRA